MRKNTPKRTYSNMNYDGEVSITMRNVFNSTNSLNDEQSYRPPIKERHVLIVHEDDAPHKRREPQRRVVVGLVFANN